MNEERHIYEALTRLNYFPNQKEGENELPPCFSTRQYTPEIVELIVACVEEKERRKLGYDQVEYSLTRHNNVPRKLGLIHPKAYAHLAKTISDNWKEIKVISENKCSIIKPDLHADGRIMIMNYEDSSSKVSRSSLEGFGKRFRVHADISNCYHSIYSHSIPWAVLGFNESKIKLSKGNSGRGHWTDELDLYTRKSKRNETLGIAIGPATSSIIVELILGHIDNALNIKGFIFKRYIDDYICHCTTHEDSQNFIRELGRQLNRFKLNLNINKTKVVELPEPISDDWVSELTASLPSLFTDSTYIKRKYLLSELTVYFDRAVIINKRTPDGSVLKYAVKTVLGFIDNSAVPSVLDYLINLAWYFPLLLPCLDSLISHESVNPEVFSERLNAIIMENAKNNRSDGMAWPLYYLKKHNLKASREACVSVYKSEDCIALLCLYSLGGLRDQIISFANDLVCKTEYEKDQYWLLLYQLYREDLLINVYRDNCVFELMKNNEVNFLPAENELSICEKYCDYLNNPFRKMPLKEVTDSDVNDKPFDVWCAEYRIQKRTI
ncbi:antiviral reverse transcriptase Drt4 [Marinomonas primoryensis]